MKQNYLYKCTDCQTVQAVDEDVGQSTWALSCRACGQVVTEHYLLEFGVIYKDKIIGKIYSICIKEKEDNDTNTGTDKKESVDEH